MLNQPLLHRRPQFKLLRSFPLTTPSLILGISTLGFAMLLLQHGALVEEHQRKEALFNQLEKTQIQALQDLQETQNARKEFQRLERKGIWRPLDEPALRAALAARQRLSPLPLDFSLNALSSPIPKDSTGASKPTAWYHQQTRLQVQGRLIHEPALLTMLDELSHLPGTLSRVQSCQLYREQTLAETPSLAVSCEFVLNNWILSTPAH